MPTDPLCPQLLAAIQRFHELNDDFPLVESTGRRVFFEFLRTNPTLSSDEIDTLYTLSEVVAALCQAGQQLKK